MAKNLVNGGGITVRGHFEHFVFYKGLVDQSHQTMPRGGGENTSTEGKTWPCGYRKSVTLSFQKCSENLALGKKKEENGIKKRGKSFPKALI